MLILNSKLKLLIVVRALWNSPHHVHIGNHCSQNKGTFNIIEVIIQETLRWNLHIFPWCFGCQKLASIFPFGSTHTYYSFSLISIWSLRPSLECYSQICVERYLRYLPTRNPIDPLERIAIRFINDWILFTKLLF